MNRRTGLLAALALVTVVAACTGGGSGDTVGFSIKVSGQVIDARSSAAVGGATVRTVGVIPASETVAAANGSFTLDVPINGYVVLEGTATGYETTLSPAILVGETELADTEVQILATVDATSYKGGFGSAVVDSAGHGHVLGHARSPIGNGISGVAALQVLPVNFDRDGPHFLSITGDPALSASATTSAGGFVFFRVSTGNVSIQAQAPGLAFQPASTVVKSGSWSIVRLPGDGPGIGGSPTPTPTATATPGPQSFLANIVPIFAARGCNGANACHKSGNPGGNFRMDQSAVQIYPNVFARVNLADPAASLMLIKPLFEAVPNHAGGNIFLNTDDPDYKRMLRWIDDGALQN